MSRYLVVWRPVGELEHGHDVVDTNTDGDSEGRVICSATTNANAHLIVDALNAVPAEKVDEAVAALARVHEVLARVDPEPRKVWSDYHVSPSGQQLARRLQAEHDADTDREPF